MRISDWSSDVCSSDLEAGGRLLAPHRRRRRARRPPGGGDRSPQPAGPALVRALRAQLRTELTLTLRNKESLLLTLGIPVGLRSDERRVGKEWVSTCRSRGCPAQ